MSSLVLRNVTYVSGLQIDMKIKNGRIVEISPPGEGQASRVVDCSGMYVSSGWIDLHVHAFSSLQPYGDEIDEIGVKAGVTTIVDAGSCGADQISELYLHAKRSKTGVFAFLNISRIGLQRIDELSNLDWIDEEKVIHTVGRYSEFIVGLKARISKSVVGNNGVEPLWKARRLADETALPIMVHIGSGPPPIEQIIPIMKKGDIITHYLNGKPNNLFDKEGKPLSVLTEAVARGVCLDVGHGTASFSFKVAEAALKYKIPLGTISTDIYRNNRLHGPVFSLADVLSKFLHIGYSLPEVIEAVTVKPAKWLKKPELASLAVGERANLTIFELSQKPTEWTDSEGEKRFGTACIIPKGVVIDDEFIEC